jgi:O-antigen/teichoic acid export membrane protein
MTGNALAPGAAFVLCFFISGLVYTGCGAFAAGSDGEYPNVDMFLLVLVSVACLFFNLVSVVLGFFDKHMGSCVLALLFNIPAFLYSLVIFMLSVWQMAYVSMIFAVVAISSLLAFLLLLRKQKRILRRIKTFT